jgi:hypothetical protein
MSSIVPYATDVTLLCHIENAAGVQIHHCDLTNANLVDLFKIVLGRVNPQGDQVYLEPYVATIEVQS